MVTIPKPIPLFMVTWFPKSQSITSHLRFRRCMRVAFQKLVFWLHQLLLLFRFSELVNSFVSDQPNPKPASSGEVVSLMSFP
jgi:hypothetical protein